MRSLCGHGDFCGTLTLVREPGREAGGVADRPVVEPAREDKRVTEKRFGGGKHVRKIREGWVGGGFTISVCVCVHRYSTGEGVLGWMAAVGVMN